MKESFAIAVSSAVFCVVFGSSHILTDEFVSLINSKATTWTARRNFENYTTEQLVKMANGVIGNSSNKLTTVFHEVRDIPDTFDSRNVWPECESIRSIRNQGEYCNKRCVPWYNKDWQNDIRHGIAAFEVTHTVEQIQHEIVINGPVAAGMVVYEDFFNYGSGKFIFIITNFKQGIYQHTHGNELGMHAVKIIGWGNENGVPYWTVANSWGTGFGEGGFFRILRGSNTADIENDSITAAFATAIAVTLCHPDIISEDFIRALNAQASTWTAKQNFENYTIDQLKSLAGLKGISRDPNFTLPVVVHDVKNVAIPNSFDARSAWAACESLRFVRDQGQCGSCWAFAAVEVMSDRLCIFSGGQSQFIFSPEELVSCCSFCGDGCSGGYLYEPFQYWQEYGIPSGGDYGSYYGCRPYTAQNGVTPRCNRQCVSSYSISFNDDLHYGVYQYTRGSLQGQHAIKILGWGTESGIPYWLVANSWGTGFGEGGFFKIPRGYNYCNIESNITAGKPYV
ncbi:hypothetical protein NQ314_016132 [Rhamnusium bicolor]|uniref:Peptidase C1A papain C-terminal domain-containing protein n=1 Tax=Rhamnusium bicolor TaxID=1586634 RepID=A0AAV8WXS1_9CUCU|nr:hypothetical protein NQ314_016132 [Rhamnusium bicolor]